MSRKTPQQEKIRLSLIAEHRSNSRCSCQFHTSLQKPEQIFLTKSGNFAILPSCPMESDPDAEQILAVLWRGQTFYIQLKYNQYDQLYLDGNPGRGFASSLELINFLESGRRLVRLSNGLSVRPRWHCASGQDDLPPHQTWFHPGLSPSHARALVASQPVGTYLVYKGRKFNAPLVLCVLGEDNQVGCFRISIRHCINRKQFFISEQFTYPSIGELVNFYSSRSLADGMQRRYRLDVPLTSTAFLAVVARLRVQELLACKGFETEFQRIKRATTSPGAEYKSEALKPENIAKNRYRNVLPYDSTRVALGDQAGYINASWIHLESPGRSKLPVRYIATQGPLDSTSGDFWQMVWQQRCRLIIMSTREIENRIKKCHRYWPTKAEGSIEVESVTGERLRVRFVGETDRPHFTATQVELQNIINSDSWLVSLLRFHDWPDHGAPREAGTVLELLKVANDINSSGRSSASPTPPMVIHCSAGLGRTGCLIAIDSLVQNIHCFGVDKAILDVSETVTRLRYQRDGMVQNLDQYRFIYSALAVHVDAKMRPPLPGELQEASRRQSVMSQFCRRLQAL